MLSDEDKKRCYQKILILTLIDDIEAKLSIICVTQQR